MSSESNIKQKDSRRTARLAIMGGLFATSWLTNIIHYSIDGIISRDGSYYLFLISKLSASNNFSDINEMYIGHRIIPPVHLFVLFLLSKFTQDSHSSAIAFNIVLASFLPVLFYKISICLTKNTFISLLAAFFASIHPTIVSLSTEVQREILFLFVIQSSILFFLKSVEYKIRYLIPSAVLFSIGLFIRIEAFEVFFLFIIVSFFWVRNHVLTKQRATFSLIVFSVTSLLTALWIVFYFKIPVETYAKHYLDLI